MIGERAWIRIAYCNDIPVREGRAVRVGIARSRFSTWEAASLRSRTAAHIAADRWPTASFPEAILCVRCTRGNSVSKLERA